MYDWIIIITHHCLHFLHRVLQSPGVKNIYFLGWKPDRGGGGGGAAEDDGGCVGSMPRRDAISSIDRTGRAPIILGLLEFSAYWVTGGGTGTIDGGGPVDVN